MQKNKITLFTAILININIMISAGLFINPKPLSQFCNSLGFSVYIIAALILTPVVLTIANLAKKYPVAGGIYVYSKEHINPFFGFISGWSYFLGKTTSATLLCHIFNSFFHAKILFLQQIPILLLDFLLLSFLILINILGISLGGKIQYIFTTAKIIPIFFVIIFGIFLFSYKLFTIDYKTVSNVINLLPIGLFAFLSFEITCSIGHLIDNPKKNLKKTIIISFFIVLALSVFFNVMLFGSMGNILATTKAPILLFGKKLLGTNSIAPKLINALVFASIIAGSFGSLTSNCWNLYALAKDNNVPFKKTLTKINKNNVPWIALIIQGIIAFILLAITQQQIPLQNMTVLGMATAYLLSCISYFRLEYKKNIFIKLLLPSLAILSSTYIIGLCIKNLFLYGLSFSFSLFFLIGIVIFLIKNKFKGN